MITSLSYIFWRWSYLNLWKFLILRSSFRELQIIIHWISLWSTTICELLLSSDIRFYYLYWQTSELNKIITHEISIKTQLINACLSFWALLIIFKFWKLQIFSLRRFSHTCITLRLNDTWWKFYSISNSVTVIFIKIYWWVRLRR